MKRRTFLKGMAAFLAAPLTFIGMGEVPVVTKPAQQLYDWRYYHASVTLDADIALVSAKLKDAQESMLSSVNAKLWG